MLTSEDTTASDASQGPALDPALFVMGGPGDPVNLNCVYVRLLLAKSDETFPYVDRVLREYDADTLMEIERHLWLHGRGYWADVIQKCHRIIMRAGQPTPPGLSIFQAVKAKVPIEVLAAPFKKLRRAGPDREKGRCPLHDENTASFYVYVDSQRWHCFGACGAGGDVIELARCLMQMGKL